jgi:hypothetical protein
MKTGNTDAPVHFLMSMTQPLPWDRGRPARKRSITRPRLVNSSARASALVCEREAPGPREDVDLANPNCFIAGSNRQLAGGTLE